MKKLSILCAYCLIIVSVQAQALTEKYLKMIPSLPKDTCNITRASIDQFVTQVSTLSDQIVSDKELLENRSETQMEGNEEAAKAQAMQQMSSQYGLSPEQMQQMQSGKMSEADKQALANQVLQQQANMSMGEVQNFSNMSEAGQQAYAEAYGTEMMATGQTSQNQQNATTTKNLNELVAQQSALNSKINTTGEKISSLYAAIENDQQLKTSKQNIEKWQSKLMSMTGVDYGQGKQMDSLAMLIKNEKIMICRKYTPRMRAALKEDFQLTKSMIPDMNQLWKTTAEITRLQSGITLPSEQMDIGTLGILEGYLERLEDAYQYKLYFPEEE